MSEYLEFKDEEIPEYNPNAKNNIYCVAGTTGVDAWFIIGTLVAIIVIMLGIYLKHDIAAFIICMMVGIIFLFICVSYLYDKYFFQKKLIRNGVVYPAVIIRSFDYVKRVGTTHASTQKITVYGIEVKCAKGIIEFTGYDGDAGKYLENPYCTVYEWNNRTIVADFKVRDKYISTDGKSYSLKPIKK